MRRRIGRCGFLVGLLGAIAAAAPLLAQPAAAGDPFELSEGPVDPEVAPVIALDAQGNGVAVWTRPGDDALSVEGRDVMARVLRAEGGAQGPAIVVSETRLGDQDDPAAAMTGDGGFLVLWVSHTLIADVVVSTYYVRAFEASGEPRGAETAVGEGSGGSVACSPHGDCWVAWFDQRTMLLRRIGTDGRPLRPAQIAVAGFNFLDERAAALAADAAGAAVVWIQSGVLRLRRFAADGSSPDPSVILATDRQAFYPAAAAAPDGSLCVAWVIGGSDVRARRFRGDGTPLGEERSIVGGEYFGSPAIAPTAEGGCIVVLSRILDLQPAGLQYVAPDGRPRGSVLPAGDVVDGVRFAFGLGAAGAPDGSFLAVWLHGAVRAQRFVLPPAGSEPCWLGDGGTLRCDSLHDGGAPELETSLDVRPDDRPLLGDVDGNGQDDLCVARAGHLLCDLAHGGRRDFDLGFGKDRDAMLLGDVNGDGRDDACVRRGGRLLCDTAHNGGLAELKIAFGRADDRPLLGDVDGDGDDDPCALRGVELLCDLAHDGAAAELALAPGFVAPGDAVFLADADGDGRDDFCAERGGRFLCDTAHDGGAADWVRDFVAPGSVALFGNVDGF